MISATGVRFGNASNNQSYHIDKEKIKEIENAHDKIVSGDPITKSRIFAEKFVNSMTSYPVKGLKGSKNSNFYEFLTMGMVPYTIGSLMLMSVFNGCNKFFKPFATEKAATLGHKMALGVLLYGIFKTVSKKFIEIPVYAATGVDVNTSYRAIKAQLPESANAPDDKKVHEYHKVYESVDFPRWDLLYKKSPNADINEYYNKIAKKMGYGDKLLDSDQQVKNDIKETVIRTKVATTLSSVIWGALGVGLAVQDDWLKELATKNELHKFSQCKSKEKFLSREYFTELRKRMETFANIFKARFIEQDGREKIKRAIKKTCESLYKGGQTPTKLSSIGGKTLVWAAFGSTVFGAVNAMFNFHKKETTCKEVEIDYNKDYTVN